MHIVIKTETAYSKTCLKRPLKKRPKIGFQDRSSLNAGPNYCRMHSALLLTFIKLPFAIKILAVHSFDCPHETGFIVYPCFAISFLYSRTSSL